MTAYRRRRVPGGTYFFSLRLARPGSAELVDQIDRLRAAYGVTCRERPFVTEAAVVLPDHLHAIWTLPPGDCDFSTRWRLIKTRFTRSLGRKAPRGLSQEGKQECGVWQRRFWEHVIRDEEDMNLHLRYCWMNPVRHGLVSRAEDWPYSSLHRDLRSGRVPADLCGRAKVPENVPAEMCFGE